MTGRNPDGIEHFPSPRPLRRRPRACYAELRANWITR